MLSVILKLNLLFINLRTIKNSNIVSKNVDSMWIKGLICKDIVCLAKQFCIFYNLKIFLMLSFRSLLSLTPTMNTFSFVILYWKTQEHVYAPHESRIEADLKRHMTMHMERRTRLDWRCCASRDAIHLCSDSCWIQIVSTARAYFYEHFDWLVANHCSSNLSMTAVHLTFPMFRSVFSVLLSLLKSVRQVFKLYFYFKSILHDFEFTWNHSFA